MTLPYDVHEVVHAPGGGLGAVEALRLVPGQHECGGHVAVAERHSRLATVEKKLKNIHFFQHSFFTLYYHSKWFKKNISDE